MGWKAMFCIAIGAIRGQIGSMKRYIHRRRTTADQTRTRVVGYIRVSTAEQAEQGVSLAAQRAKLEAYALATDLELVAVIEDAGVSAKNLARTGLQDALQRLCRGEADGLLVAKLDRLTRSVRDLGELVERYFADRYSLLSVGDSIDTRSAAGRLVLNVLGSVSQWEREAIGERTSAALQHLRATGRYTGGEAPFGWALDDDGSLIPVEHEQVIIRRARSFRADGWSFRGIGFCLEEEGFRSRTGQRFDAQQVRRMITNPRVAA